ncbi:DoxX family protein [Bacillus sp. DX4.1]|uniref:DoxX family protein n=1 Tax=Bacillus sp. DX4.1 TaxID=3055867 RepID=UPI0025A1E230|nr:DoxX family protein [Bacillus sp. DX4.1]MDM5190059.1 DoxX family protein [Bacillus sp. DX4.1]
MVIQFLRENKAVSVVLAVLRIYLGYTWLMAGIGKLKGTGFDATGYLQGAIEKSKGAQPAVQSWWASFLQDFAIPNVDLFNTLVTWGEILVGIGLIVGCLTKTAVFFGLVMNFSYMFSGSLGVNPQMVILSMFILVAGMNAGKLGIDGWIVPKLLGSKSQKRQKQAA